MNPYTYSELLRAVADQSLLELVPQRMDLKALVAKDVRGDTIFHKAAQSSQLNALPKKWLNALYLTTPNIWQQTPLHYAATHECLYQVPPEVLTFENITRLCKQDESVIHIAATNGCLDQIPPRLLTPEVLLFPSRKDRFQKTPIFFAAQRNHLDKISVTPELAKHYRAIRAEVLRGIKKDESRASYHAPTEETQSTRWLAQLAQIALQGTPPQKTP